MSDLGMGMAASIRAEVETLLLDNPKVLAASLVSEESVDGRRYPVAYVVPHPEPMRAARIAIYEADKKKRVSHWKRAFDNTYRSKGAEFSPSFVGWTSCYTNKPLPESEMEDWLSSTADFILSLKPRKVLEIGCGVGLLVQAVAPKCASYTGTDLSPVALDNLRAFIASKPGLGHVTLLEREGQDLSDQPSASVDTVIINSVIQYFPDLQYLQDVLKQATRIVAPGGRIVIGDVRDLGTLSLFHNAVQLARAPREASAQWLKRRISLAIDHERELVIDPQFFLTLAQSDPHIDRAEVLVKRGKAHNELTRYRYDVVLYVGEGRPEADLGVSIEWQAKDHSVEKIAARLDAAQMSNAVIRNVPNRRLADDIAAMQGVQSADGRRSVQSIRDSLTAAPDFGEEPEDFWSLADKGLCDVRLNWPPSSTEGRFDVALMAFNGSKPASSPPQSHDPASISQVVVATDPLEAAYKQQLGAELLQILRDRLPESSVPAAVLAVTTLPFDEVAAA